MSPPIIEASNLSKRYQLGAIGATTLKESFHRGLDRLRGRAPQANAGEFWALRDVSFSVQPGEVLGVIGRNGAGKSTLLKILSRITEPTTGRVVMRGRVSSLLEVGTGFHPELSGRDNVFLNGAILGMTQAEIRRKFDEIVAFAEVEQFLDTPVKRYSSGMYVRLAFAVAAHLDPEILIVDEVLAVGDAAFQKKCLGKMSTVAREGRTILFVSHNMAAVRKLCTSAMLLVDGAVTQRGDLESAIAAYLADGEASDACTVHDVKAPHHPFTLNSVEVLNARRLPSNTLPNHEPFHLRFTYTLAEPLPHLRVGLRLHAYDSTVVLSTTNCDSAREAPGFAPGRYVAEVEFPAGFLNRGYYYIWIGIDVPLVASVLSVDRAAS
ncbi:MAG: ABC transporter ATP-binding protein, partial [Opitutales bacterium]